MDLLFNNRNLPVRQAIIELGERLSVSCLSHQVQLFPNHRPDEWKDVPPLLTLCGPAQMECHVLSVMACLAKDSSFEDVLGQALTRTLNKLEHFDLLLESHLRGMIHGRIQSMYERNGGGLPSFWVGDLTCLLVLLQVLMRAEVIYDGE